MKKLVFGLFLVVSCASKPTPQINAPEWTTVPSVVLDSLCARLQMDGIAATGSPVSLVSTTRPLASQQSFNALALTAKGRLNTNRAAKSATELNRSLDIATDGATCSWRAFPASQIHTRHDELIVEISAPGVHPFDPKTGGVLARVTVGGQGASWYWVTLFPGSGRWVVGPTLVLVQ